MTFIVRCIRRTGDCQNFIWMNAVFSINWTAPFETSDSRFVLIRCRHTFMSSVTRRNPVCSIQSCMRLAAFDWKKESSNCAGRPASCRTRDGLRVDLKSNGEQIRERETSLAIRRTSRWRVRSPLKRNSASVSQSYIKFFLLPRADCIVAVRTSHPPIPISIMDPSSKRKRNGPSPISARTQADAARRKNYARGRAHSPAAFFRHRRSVRCITVLVH